MKKLHQINFWKRLSMFVSEVNVNDPMSEEEKQMILRIAKEYEHSANFVVSGSLPSNEDIARWSNSREDELNSAKQKSIAVHNRCEGARWMREIVEQQRQ